MGEAREVMDRVTKAVFAGDWEAAAECYAPDCVCVTPDAGELKGREEVVAYLKEFLVAFPDARYQPLHAHECGNTAVDEGFFVGTNSGPLTMPDGDTIPATGQLVSVRSCDCVTVTGAMIESHRFYFDQMEFLDQLGLLPDAPG